MAASEGWLQVAQEALKLPGLLVEIYGDLARPGVRQVGKALETVIGLGNTILWPIAWANDRARIALEKNMEKYRKSLENVPEEKIVAVSPEIGVPIAEKLAYVQDDALVSLYVELLKSASISDTVERAHPSFVNVINNLSPDEARFLDHFIVTGHMTCAEPRAVDLATQQYSVMWGILVPEAVTQGLTFPRKISSYVANLVGLGLITLEIGAELTDEPAYISIEKSNTAGLREAIEGSKFADRGIEFARGAIAISIYGRDFLRACRAGYGDEPITSR